MIATIEGFSLREIYEAAYVSKFDRSFQVFERDPSGVLKAIGQADAIALMKQGYRPLLPAQVRQRLLNDHRWRAEGHDVDALDPCRQASFVIRHAPSPRNTSLEQTAASGSTASRFICKVFKASSCPGSHGSDSHASTIAWMPPNPRSTELDVHAGAFGWPLVNPASGLPMMGNSMIDVGGNVYGTGPSRFD